MPEITKRRYRLMNDIFPSGIPRLWCPPLTHYTPSGDFDLERMEAHFSFLAPWIHAFFAPSATGDGIEMNKRETKKSLKMIVDFCEKLDACLLINVFSHEAGDLGKELAEYNQEFEQHLPVRGFAINAPGGKGKSRQEIEDNLAKVLDLGLPTVLRQMPNVTENEISEISHDTFIKLAGKYPNFYLFIDSSGSDKMVRTIKKTEGVSCIRGAEQDYAQWYGTPYHGFLLSSANCFAKELQQMMEALDNSENEKGETLSALISAVIGEIFVLTASLQWGNVFSNANKAIDHFLAYGKKGYKKSPPRTYGGEIIPKEIMQKIGVVLEKHELLPQQGYL